MATNQAGPHPLVVGTQNSHKVRELRQLLADLPFELKTAAECGVPDVEETGVTFEDNAVLKVCAAYERTGQLCLADDSGLAVDALDGAPGVYSARFSGANATAADNNLLLLERLAGVPEAERGGAFVCCLALLVPAARAVPVPDGAPWRRPTRSDLPPGAVLYVIEGRAHGQILDAPRGAEGFGYDPLFFYPELGQTFAELAADEKNAVSHRGRALAGLRACLEAVTVKPPR